MTYLGKVGIDTYGGYMTQFRIYVIKLVDSLDKLEYTVFVVCCLQGSKFNAVEKK